MKKKVLSIVAVVLVLCCAIGGTLAWLTDKTDPVVNTFTVGDINIELTESENLNLKMVPGNTITKDPKVTVQAGSEKCWLFVKVDKSANYGDFLEDYKMAADWIALTGEEGVYYQIVNASTANQVFEVLLSNQVAVKDAVTKAQMEGIKNNTTAAPTLTFTAYAVQFDNVATAADAWTKAIA